MFNQFLGEEGNKKITQWMVISLMLLSVFLLVKVLEVFKKLPNIGREIYPQSTIMVSGSGEAYAIPDIASFSFSVTEVADTVKQAQEKVDAKINKALGLMRESGIEDKDIKTTGYNVYPKYEWNQVACLAYPCPSGKSILVGYEVSQNITIKARKTENVGDLVTKIGGTGVSNISGVEFTVDNREEFVAQAREAAIKEAKTKAKVLTKQLGVKLGKLMYYNENGAYPYYAEGKGSGADMMSSSVVPMKAELPKGETKITSNVSVTYEIR